MLTKGAIGNLINRYKAVLKKCNLINTFGSLAVASMLVLGGAPMVAQAAYPYIRNETAGPTHEEKVDDNVIYGSIVTQHGAKTIVGYSDEDKRYDIEISPDGNQQSIFMHKGNISELTINAKNLYINGVDSTGTDDNIHVYRGTDNVAVGHSLIINATEEINMNFNAKVGMLAQSGSNIEIKAKKTTINAENCLRAIRVLGRSSLNIYGDFILNALNTVAIEVRDSTVNIGIDEGKTYTTQITGDIWFSTRSGGDYYKYEGENGGESQNAKADSAVNITLSGKNSFWKGDPYLDWGNTPTVGELNIDRFNITLENGGTWWPQATTSDIYVDENEIETKGNITIAIPRVTLNGGNINIPPKGVDAEGNSIGDIIVRDIDGSGGNINFVEAAPDKRGSFTAETPEAPLNVQVIDENGKVKTADETTPEEVHDYQKQVKNTKGNVIPTTASADRGTVNDGFVLDSNGNIISGGGVSTITKSVLELASVNTVALDKILTNDVRKRMGDIRSDKNTTGVWMRWDGGKLKGNGLTNNFNTIQIGGDTKVGKNCRLGVAGSFTHGDTDFARGNGELEGFSFALYSTWMGENGMFADVVARLGHFSTEVNVEGRSGDMDNRVASLSGEYGWRLPVCDQFFIEPQVELAYTYVSSEDLELGASKFKFDSVDSLIGRAGVVFGWNLPDERGNIYARASVLQQFMGDAKISGTNGSAYNVQKIDGDDTWLEYGIGANVKLTDSTYIWADVERTEGADIEEEWRGTVGIRYSF